MIKSIALLVSSITASFSLLANTEVTGSAGGELRYFMQDALYEPQERTYGSVFFSPETYTEWNDGEEHHEELPHEWTGTTSFWVRTPTKKLMRLMNNTITENNTTT